LQPRREAIEPGNKPFFHVSTDHVQSGLMADRRIAVESPASVSLVAR
jgi:hypothetical protein